MVLLEAASCAKPIIASDVSGCREIVRPGENGMLVPVRDAEALAGAMEKLLGEREIRRSMGESGRRMVEQEFSPEIIIAETLHLYREMTS